jgi:hypothetical protein
MRPSKKQGHSLPRMIRDGIVHQTDQPAQVIRTSLLLWYHGCLLLLLLLLAAVAAAAATATTTSYIVVRTLSVCMCEPAGLV